MKFLRLSLILAAAPLLAPAVTVSYIDPFGAAASSCASAICDVIGDKLWFDLDRFSVTIDPSTMTGSILTSLNFGQGNTLAPFTDFGVGLQAADVLFRVNGFVQYGVALTSHSGLQAGSLYVVNSNAGVLTARDVLRSTSYAYRQNFTVWLNDDHRGSVTQIAPGTVTTTTAGNGVTSGRLQVAVNFAITPEFVSSLYSRAMRVDFASATCGNDIVSFAVDPGPTPEPSTFLLMASGLLVLVRGCRWRPR